VVIISYVALYSVSQFLLDFLRQSEPVIWLGLKELQLTAIVSLVVLVPLLTVIWRRTDCEAQGHRGSLATGGSSRRRGGQGGQALGADQRP
jgi:prolipoprotein diacylglyceryltransferase